MGETGITVRFPGSLDPTAKEFRPRNPTSSQPCYPYACNYPTTGGGVQPVTFFEGGGGRGAAVAVWVPYPQLSAPSPLVAVPAAPLSTSPTRSLLLSSMPSEMAVSESTLRRELEVFGDVRGVEMEGLRQGMVTVHFYDLRHAEMALTAIRRQHMQHQTRLRNHYALLFMTCDSLSDAEFCSDAAATLPTAARGLVGGRAVWAQYIFPACNAVPDGMNQGTIVIFNLGSEVVAENLREIFEAFGPIKELRDTPSKKSQRFVEFYDIRDAAKALKHMNGKQIHGKPVVIEFSRPGGHGRKFYHAAASTISNPFPPLPRKYSPRFAHDVTPPLHFHQPQLSSQKSSTIKEGSHDKIANSGSTEAAMASMNLGGGEFGNGVEERHSDGLLRRNSIKKHWSESTVGSTKHQQPARSGRHWKGKQAKKHETRFLIKEDAIVESSSIDSRTTVMIKNIPNKYSQKLLLNMLDNHCIQCNEQIGDHDDQPLSSYDFVYLPIDFNNKCNVGYGFANMTSPEATLRLYKAFHLQHWEVFNSRKICEITYARIQGLEALKEHFKNSKFPCLMDHYLPVAFSPPRDGRQLTEPLPIVGDKHQITTIPIGRDSVVGVSDDVLSSSSCSQSGGGVDGDDDIKTGSGEVDRVSGGLLVSDETDQV